MEHSVCYSLVNNQVFWLCILHPSAYVCMVDSMCIAIHLFSFHVYVKTFPSCSHTMLISLTSSFPTPFNLSSACLISLSSFPNILPFLLDSLFPPTAAPCSFPYALAFSFSSTFPRVVYPALSFHCVQLSVRGFSAPHALLERRPVKRLDMYTHVDTVMTRRFTQCWYIYDTWCQLASARSLHQFCAHFSE